MQHTLIAKVENIPGVLNRVASLFRRRNFNIDSLNVGRSENPNVSRMTIVIDNSAVEAAKVQNNLYKLVNVIEVQDVTHQPVVSRDLALIKVAATAEKRHEITNLANIFRANVIDVAADSVILEITGTVDKIESLMELLRPFGILEMVTTGQVAMLRGKSNGTGPNGHNTQGHYKKSSQN